MFMPFIEPEPKARPVRNWFRTSDRVVLDSSLPRCAGLAQNSDLLFEAPAARVRNVA